MGIEYHYTHEHDVVRMLTMVDILHIYIYM